MGKQNDRKLTSHSYQFPDKKGRWTFTIHLHKDGSFSVRHFSYKDGNNVKVDINSRWDTYKEAQERVNNFLEALIEIEERTLNNTLTEHRVCQLFTGVQLGTNIKSQ